jgi:hypothetical protein
MGVEGQHVLCDRTLDTLACAPTVNLLRAMFSERLVSAKRWSWICDKFRLGVDLVRWFWR